MALSMKVRNLSSVFERTLFSEGSYLWRQFHVGRCCLINEKTYLRFDPETGARIKKHPETPRKGEYSVEPLKGKVYAKLPFKTELKVGKTYCWCVCGQSHTQPFCDGTHKYIYERSISAPYFQPMRFQVTETKDYWLCNCKQTENQPFCDGSHKRDIVKKAKINQ